MTILDRMLFKNYVRNYLIVLTCMLTLYVVVDLFMNLNDFANNKAGFAGVVAHIVGYYSVQIAVIFGMLSEAITMLAAAFTVAWMQRSNELLPQLSAGVSTQRVIRPILLGSLITIGLGPVNSEVIIPRIADFLTIPRDDPQRLKPIKVRGAYDITKEHIAGADAFRNELKVMQFEYTSTAESGAIHLLAAEAVYVPPASGPGLSGGWRLYKTRPETMPKYPKTESEQKESEKREPEKITEIVPGQFFVKSNVDFDTLTRQNSWFIYAPTSRLWDLLNQSDTSRQSAVAVLFHMRLTKPIIGMLMVLLGLAVILRDQNRHVFISAGYCLIVLAMYYVLTLGCKYLGDHDILPPPLAAWLPAIIYGPIVLAQFDAIHT